MSLAQNAFVFSGQGSQYYQMGKALLDADPIFREWMLHLDDQMHHRHGYRVVTAIYSSAKSEPFDRTLLTHPAIFMVEYSLAQSLMRRGVKPDLTVGASLGTFAAAAVSGCLSAEDALSAVVAQARALESRCERGGMIAILGDPALYCEAFLRDHSELAGINFSTHFAVAAEKHNLASIEAALKQRGISHQRLAVSFAFHSRWIGAAQDEFESFMRTVPMTRGSLPVVCCEQAKALTELPDNHFWNIVRRQIRFRDALAYLEQRGTYRYIDLGPSGTMATFVKYGLTPESSSTAHAILTPYGGDQKNFDALLALH